jgi:hypothetical protein
MDAAMNHRSSKTHRLGVVATRMLSCFLNKEDSRKRLIVDQR